MKYRRTMTEAIKLRWMPRWREPTIDDPNPEPSRYHKRGKAIIEVLRRLPKDAIRRLEESEPFLWLVPDVGELGHVHDFPMTYDDFGKRYTRILYLSPRLERFGHVSVVAMVAHELAHIVLLSEYPAVPSYDAHFEGEDAADELACAWGFGRELRKHHQLHRRPRRWTIIMHPRANRAVERDRR